MKETVYIVDYAYGFNAKTCEPDFVSRLRTDAARHALAKHPEAYIILSAGLKERTGDCGPLADMTRHLLISEGIPAEKILLNPIGRDTLSETLGAYVLTKHTSPLKIVCATSAFHAPRVFLLWVFLFGIRPTIVTSKIIPPTSEKFYECIKIPRDILRALAYHIKRVSRLGKAA